VFPHVFERGLDVLRGWGLQIREYPSTRAPADQLRANAALRARDVGLAFADPSVRAVIASIGGDDSVRLLPLLDTAAIAANPKILLGYSDTCTLLALARRLGLVAFHGPSVMAGLSQLAALPPACGRHVHELLFEPASGYRYPAFEHVSHGYPQWRDPSLVGQVNPPRAAGGWHVLQGSGSVTGELFGGCLEVLDWIRGTRAWPAPREWSGRLLFLEPSEEKPGPEQVQRILRSFGACGAFDGVAGLMLGRPRDHDADEAAAFEAAVLGVVAGELGLTSLPIVANLPFGHTDPQWVLPIGVGARLDLDAQTLELVEPWLS
jgi:muramoyltetrapeptide carboxypeptidase LdcA involved in peptidoglycan recycling